jgi:hypothetical protein
MFMLNMAAEIFAEILDNFQHTVWLIFKSQNCAWITVLIREVRLVTIHTYSFIILFSLCCHILNITIKLYQMDLEEAVWRIKWTCALTVARLADGMKCIKWVLDKEILFMSVNMFFSFRYLLNLFFKECGPICTTYCQEGLLLVHISPVCLFFTFFWTLSYFSKMAHFT